MTNVTFCDNTRNSDNVYDMINKGKIMRGAIKTGR